MIPGIVFYNPLTTGAAVLSILVLIAYSWPLPEWNDEVSVAFLGNSMQYFNDFPRFMEVLSGGKISQSSCLHGDSTIPNMLRNGNGMFGKWNTSDALIKGFHGEEIFDYGACSVPQLLMGKDPVLTAYDGRGDYEEFLDSHNETYYADGTNPCYEDPVYLEFAIQKYHEDNPNLPKWDFVVINDNTRSPAEYETRRLALHVLNSTFVDLFKHTGAIPVFWFTYGYWTELRNTSNFKDVPTFTSLTYVGYRKYADLVGDQLPEAQKPRIAPIGFAFLTIWEENYDFWLTLFHWDYIHPSPAGTYLEGLIMHYTLYGHLPKKSDVILDDMSTLWRTARLMGPIADPPKPFPTREEAVYLFRIAQRVTQEGHIPSSFIMYENGEAADGDSILTDADESNRPMNRKKKIIYKQGA